RRLHDALVLRRQRLEGVALLVSKFPSIVNPADAHHRMAEAPLGDVGVDAGARQQRAARPAQIMQPIIREARAAIKIGLAISESAERAPAGGAKNVVAAQHWLRRDDGLRRLAQRDQGVLAALITRARNDPRCAAVT